MSIDPPHLVKTTVWRSLVRRMDEVHRRSAAGPFAGPPGIGKSTALDSVIAAQPHAIVRVELDREGAPPTAVLQAVLTAIRNVTGSPWKGEPVNGSRLRGALEHAILEWRDCIAFRNRHEGKYRTTIAIDEAQRLSRKGLEALRYYHDGASIKHPLGLIFLGNNEFHLHGAESFLSGPMESRADPPTIYTHNDLSDEDLSLIIEQRADFKPDALALMLDHCKSRLVNRDLRQLGKKLDRIVEAAAGRPVSPVMVKSTLGLT